MPSITQVFQEAGGWMCIVALLAIAFYAVLIAQYVKRDRANYLPILLGLLLGLMLSGPWGAVVGLYQVGVTLASLQANGVEALVREGSRGLAISMYTTIYSTMLSIIGAVLLGFVTHRARQSGSEALEKQKAKVHSSKKLESSSNAIMATK